VWYTKYVHSTFNTSVLSGRYLVQIWAYCSFVGIFQSLWATVSIFNFDLFHPAVNIIIKGWDSQSITARFLFIYLLS
jgi:hypothetical protein